MGAYTALTCSSGSRLRRAPWILLIAVGLLPFAAEAQSPQGEAQREAKAAPGRSAPVSASIFFCETNNVQCRTKINEFDLDAIRDLFIFAAWRNVQGEHMQTVRLLLPDGNLYQASQTRFAVGTAKSLDAQAAVRSRE